MTRFCMITRSSPSLIFADSIAGAVAGRPASGIFGPHGTCAGRPPRLGVILLKPTTPTLEDQALREIWFNRVFAHVDPGFDDELQRLLAVHPGSLELLHASNCRVTMARAHEALGILHAARLKQPELCEMLQKEMANAAQQHPEQAERAAAWLLDAADSSWNSMDQAQRYTMLALPIHRCSTASSLHWCLLSVTT